MDTQVAKWGNSYALRIPAGLAKTLNVAEGSKVQMSIEGDALVVRPVHERQNLKLADLLKGITPENLHAETGTGASVGDEF